MAIIGEDSYYRLRVPIIDSRGRIAPSPLSRTPEFFPHRLPLPRSAISLHASQCVAALRNMSRRGRSTGQHVEGTQFPSFQTVRTYRAKPCELDPHDHIFTLWIIIRSSVHLVFNLIFSINRSIHTRGSSRHILRVINFWNGKSCESVDGTWIIKLARLGVDLVFIVVSFFSFRLGIIENICILLVSKFLFF